MIRAPELTQMIRARGPELTQMIHAPRSRTDSNDSRSAVPNWLKWFALRGPELTQMIRAPELTQMIRAPELTQMIRALRSRTDSNDSRSAVPIWVKEEKSLTSLDWKTLIQFL